MTDDYALRFPIGKVGDQQFTGMEPYDEKIKIKALREFQALPSLLEESVLNLDASQLQVPYREEGWTIQQVVHHVADSHMNANVRIKLALTEDNPIIKPYDQAEWAKLEDTRLVAINVSITLLHALHERLFVLLESLTPEQWERTIFHPAQNKQVTIWQTLAVYVWHGKHHVAHITGLRNRMNWN
ncbi:MAG: YfiT family bacillithiol transferase [Chitinophagaceae bacterium]